MKNELIVVGVVALVAAIIGGCVAGLVGGQSASFSGQSHTNSGLVINEDGTADSTRVESDSQTHMLFVDGTNNKVGIASSTPSTELSVTGGLAVSATSTFYGNVNLNTANTATSSVAVGCVQTYATSTATPIKQMFFASSTLNIDGATVTAGFGGGTMQGLVLWGFGLCPGR